MSLFKRSKINEALREASRGRQMECPAIGKWVTKVDASKWHLRRSMKIMDEKGNAWKESLGKYERII